MFQFDETGERLPVPGSNQLSGRRRRRRRKGVRWMPVPVPVPDPGYATGAGSTLLLLQPVVPLRRKLLPVSDAPDDAPLHSPFYQHPQYHCRRRCYAQFFGTVLVSFFFGLLFLLLFHTDSTGTATSPWLQVLLQDTGIPTAFFPATSTSSTGVLLLFLFYSSVSGPKPMGVVFAAAVAARSALTSAMVVVVVNPGRRSTVQTSRKNTLSSEWRYSSWRHREERQNMRRLPFPSSIAALASAAADNNNNENEATGNNNASSISYSPLSSLSSVLLNASSSLNICNSSFDITTTTSTTPKPVVFEYSTLSVPNNKNSTANIRERSSSPSSNASFAQQQDQSIPSITTTPTTARSNKPKRVYTRKRSIPVTELLSQTMASQRQMAYESLLASTTATAASGTAGADTAAAISIWSFESLFPAPVLDVESIDQEIQFIKRQQQQGNNNESNATTGSSSRFQTLIKVIGIANKSNVNSNVISSNNYDVPSQVKTTRTTSSSSTFYGSNAMLRFYWDKKVPNNKSDLNNSTVVGIAMEEKVDPLLTRMVEDRVYGYRRLPTGDYQYETSLLAKGGAVQFRNGVRLGNPLSINADLLTHHAKKELQHGRVEEAMELYEIAVTTDPADGRAYLGLSRCAERRRDFCLARKWLLQGIACSVSIMDGSVPDRGANPFLLQTLGCLEEKLGNLARAEALYLEAVQSRASHAAAWVALGVLRTRKLGYPVTVGRKCFQSAEMELKNAGKEPSAHVYTSWANLEYHKAGDKSKSRELFQKAIKIDAKCSAAWLQLGVLEAACNEWEEAEVCFETVLKFDQRNSRVLQAYALMETKRPQGDSRKAIGLFERALQANPRDAGVLQAYALYVAEWGDVSSARDLLQRGTLVNKRHAALWQAWGVLESRQGQIETARKLFQQGIWACGHLTGGQSGGYQCDRLWQAWGVLEASENQHAAARRCFSRSLDANGRNIPAYTAWALMEEGLGNVKDARMVFEDALSKFSPGSNDKMALWRSYELMEQRLGNVEAAQNVYQRSVRETFVIQDDIEVTPNVSNKSTQVPVLLSSEKDNGRRSRICNTQNDIPKKQGGKLNEFEVVRWESQGGEVWMNERAIEGKVPLAIKKKMAGGQRRTQKERQQP